VQTKSQFKANKLDGEVVGYAEDGKVKERAFYQNGKPRPAPGQPLAQQQKARP
jgi:antitoxin component YwqK of YwqJK toxin-antitoxin module